MKINVHISETDTLFSLSFAKAMDGIFKQTCFFKLKKLQK